MVFKERITFKKTFVNPLGVFYIILSIFPLLGKAILNSSNLVGLFTNALYLLSYYSLSALKPVKRGGTLCNICVFSPNKSCFRNFGQEDDKCVCNFGLRLSQD